MTNQEILQNHIFELSSYDVIRLREMIKNECIYNYRQENEDDQELLDHLIDRTFSLILDDPIKDKKIIITDKPINNNDKILELEKRIQRLEANIY